jgi:hypothetical protein
MEELAGASAAWSVGTEIAAAGLAGPAAVVGPGSVALAAALAVVLAELAVALAEPAAAV